MLKINKVSIYFFFINTILLCGLIFLANKNLKINSKPLVSDSQQSTFLAYHLVTDGFHSMDGETPSNFREPVISFLNALNIARLQPEKNQIEKEQLISDPELILEMTKLNLVYLILIYGISYFLARKLQLPRVLASVAAFIPVLFFSVFTSFITSVNSDLPAAILLLLFSVCILNYLEGRKKKDLIISGLILGLLTLTKAVFLYLFILFLPAILIFDLFFVRDKILRSWLSLGVLLISFTIPVGSWMIRNYIQMGTTSISDRGGEILLIRAIKNQMSDKEYWGGFYAYAPEVLQTGFFERFLRYQKEDLLDGGSLQRLNRGLKCDSLALAEGRFEEVKSYLRIAQLEHRGLTNYYRTSLDIDNPDDVSKSKALNLIFTHPLNHLKACFLFGWRGIWFYKGRHLIPVLVTFLMYLSLFVLFVKSFWTKDKTLFLITILPILYFLFHAFLTHLIPRYSGILVPLLSVMCILSFFLGFRKINRSSNL
jgi:hypothetical protein